MVATAFLLLIALLALSVPVAASLGVLGFLLSKIYSPVPLSLALGEVAWGASTSFILVAVPFFVLLGEILLRSGIAERMYAAMAQWVSWLPGGLMHANVGACSLFAATCGSSVATAATIGTVAVDLIEKNRYNERIFLGSLAAGGTLGILIPPSINLIVYGVLTETSIPKLFLAGVIPGLVLAAAFMLTILIACLIRPAWGGRRIATTWSMRLRSLPDLVPPLAIFMIVIGSIYAGWATPTESAALGVVAALLLAAFRRRLSLQLLRQAIEGTMITTAMIMAILIAAYFLNFVIAVIGLTTQVSRFVTELGLSPAQTLFAVIVFYLILGMFMETLSMMVATVPIIAPVVIDMGYDPIWFGIILLPV
jgi:C4-dicarboxylate transporter, DctM subunit